MWFIVIGAGVVLLAILGRNKLGADSSVTLPTLDNGGTGAGTADVVAEPIPLKPPEASAKVYAPVTRGRPPTTTGAPATTAPVPVAKAPLLGSVAVGNAALQMRLGRR